MMEKKKRSRTKKRPKAESSEKQADSAEMKTRMQDMVVKTLSEHTLKQNQWLCGELIKGIKQLGVDVWVESEAPRLGCSFKTFLHIETKEGKRYSAGLNNLISITEKEE